jgi:hypothetical protein
MASTACTCFAVPGLNDTRSSPARGSCSMISRASSSSGMPAETVMPSMAAPSARSFWISPSPFQCRFQR